MRQGCKSTPLAFLSRSLAKIVDLIILLVGVAVVDVVLGTTFVVHSRGLERHPIVGATFASWCEYRGAKTMKSGLAIAVFVMIFLSIPLDMAGQAKFITFDVPSAVNGISPASINSTGEIAGSYSDANFVSHGFIRKPDGTIIKLDVPNSDDTSAASINSAGVITGQANRQGAHGFLLGQHGTIIMFDVPDAVGTAPLSINPAGVITGQYSATNDPAIGNACISGIAAIMGSELSHGFVREANGTITKFDVPGAGTRGPGGTFPLSINPAGTITGNYSDDSCVSHGFVREPNGRITTFDNPDPGTPPFQTIPDLIPYSINPAGTITGNYINARTAASHGFLRAPDGTVTTFEAPGAGTSSFEGTYPISINPAGVITGVYVDNSSMTHGFVREPNGSITTFDAPGAFYTYASSINSAGTITGYYVDNNGFHGFLRIRCER